MARLGGKGRSSAIGEFASDAGRLLGDLAAPLLSRRGSGLRDDLLSRGLLLAFLAAFTLLVLDLRNSPASIALAAPPALLAFLFALAGGAAWREWRGRLLGRMHLWLGAIGGIACLTLARGWAGGDPSRLWLLAAFLGPALLIEATRLTLHGEGTAYRRAIERTLLLFGIPGVLFAVLPYLGPRASLPLRDALAAVALTFAALGTGLAMSLACLRTHRPIDVRQRGKLVAAAEGAALAALLAAVALRARGAAAPGAAAILGLGLAPVALAIAALRDDLLWVDRFLRRGLALVLALPLAALPAWAAVRAGGAPGVLLAAALILAAPAVAGRLGRRFEATFHRSCRRRRRALGQLPDRLAGTRTLEEIAMAVGAVGAEAYPGVSVSVLAADPESGDLREIVPGEDSSAGRTLPPEHPLSVYLRTATAPLTRYSVLSGPRFAQARGTWLKDLDEFRAAALVPCRDGEGLQGVLLLGGQVRGGFFTEDEIGDGATAGAALAPALARAIQLEDAARRIARLESRLAAARMKTGQAEADGSQAMEDLEESTRHVMAAYTELKVREGEAREIRARLAASAKVLLAGRVAERMAGPLGGALAQAERQRGGQGRAAAGLRRARVGLGAIEAITRRDPTTPCDLREAVDAALAALEEGWRGRIRVDVKIADAPPIVWPVEALQAAVLALLLNAEEAVEGQGTIAIEARGVEGRVVTVADAEESGAGGPAPTGQSEGKIAWMSGAPRIQIVISDDGRGIAPEHQDRLFHPFFTTKPRGSGALGLGLAIVADALAHHGGSIRIESEPDQGARVVLELPGAASRKRRRASRTPS